LGATQGAGAAACLNERHGLARAHGFAAIFAVRARQSRRKFEPNHFSFDYGRRLHDRKLISLDSKNKGGFSGASCFGAASVA
jgi:hypothetical protein